MKTQNPYFKQEYVTEFNGMSFQQVSLDDLLATRNNLISKIQSMLKDNHKEFLISFKLGEPHWELLNLKKIENLPAVKWKLYNIKNMTQDKRKAAVKKLGKSIY